MKHQTGLWDHLQATRLTFIERTGLAPARLALGRWDARELANLIGVHANLLPSEVMAEGRDGEVSMHGIPVLVDFRIGRMPGAMWWQA